MATVVLAVALSVVAPMEMAAEVTSPPRTGPCVMKWGHSEQRHRLVRCVGEVYPAFGYGVAHDIGHRESGPLLLPKAFNPSSGACGIFQHLHRYWEDRVRAYLKPSWFGRRTWTSGNLVSCFNARANTLVTARMVQAGGWGPWS